MRKGTKLYTHWVYGCEKTSLKTGKEYKCRYVPVHVHVNVNPGVVMGFIVEGNKWGADSTGVHEESF